MKTLLALMILFPLATAVANAVVGRRLPRRGVEITACVGVLGALAMAAAAMVAAGRTTYDFHFSRWIDAGGFTAAMSVHFDPLAACLALMVTFVSAIIHLYSVSFMRQDGDYLRYFCYLNLFVSAMLVLTLADNLLWVYLGWEGVGFCSYALIGFWYQSEANTAAGRKAFICTCIGDVAFGVALALFFVLFHNLSIAQINTQAASLSAGTATLLGLLLLWAAVGKSAQLPLSVWLPDAMAGPSPVSALIHAATMVTAGVYLLMRLYPVVSLSATAMAVIAGVGAVTTLYGALAALAQWDLKKMLAYSTISQVGYMFLAVGAGDIVGGTFHLVSHAFFKALLFLAAGFVIQALAEEHSIFRMGNLRRLMPSVYWLFLAGAVSLSAFPLLGGFFSKDRILLATFLHPAFSYKVWWFIGVVAAVLTPIYTFRAFFIAFPERPDGRRPEELHPPPRFMAAVLWPLAVLALGDGLLNLPGGIGKNFLGNFMASVPGARPDLGASVALEWAMGLGTAASVIATIILAYYLYRLRPAREPAGGFQAFLLSGLYLDHLYRLIFIRPYLAVARGLWRMDERGLDAGIERGAQTLFRPYRAMCRFFWRQVDERVLDKGIERSALALFRPYRVMARFVWRQVDERTLDEGVVRAAAQLLTLSRVLGYWATGRLSTYLQMLLLGSAIMFAALAASWLLW